MGFIKKFETSEKENLKTPHSFQKYSLFFNLNILKIGYSVWNCSSLIQI